jgi:hypothetical protein
MTGAARRLRKCSLDKGKGTITFDYTGARKGYVICLKKH